MQENSLKRMLAIEKQLLSLKNSFSRIVEYLDASMSSNKYDRHGLYFFKSKHIPAELTEVLFKIT